MKLLWNKDLELLSSTSQTISSSVCVFSDFFFFKKKKSFSIII